MKKMIIVCLLIGILLSVSVGANAEKTVIEKPVWTAVGDGNRDSKIDAKDALIALKMAVIKMAPPYYMGEFNAPNKDLLTQEQIAYYYYGCRTVLDVDNNDIINAKDALQILQYAVGKRETFPRTDISIIDSMIWEKVSTPTDITSTDK